MSETPTMSLRVPTDPELRKALRKLAKALRDGRISTRALLGWIALSAEPATDLAARLAAVEARVATLEGQLRLMAINGTPVKGGHEDLRPHPNPDNPER